MCPGSNISSTEGKNFLCCISDVSFNLVSFTKGMKRERGKKTEVKEQVSERQRERGRKKEGEIDHKREMEREGEGGERKKRD